MVTKTVRLLEFDLPSGGGGMAAQMARYKILKKFKELQDTHHIQYKSMTVGYKLEVWFENEEDYMIFFLAYNPKDDWRQFRVIEKTVNNET